MTEEEEYQSHIDELIITKKYNYKCISVSKAVCRKKTLLVARIQSCKNGTTFV